MTILAANNGYWQRFLAAKARDRVGQAHLLIGSIYCYVEQFAMKMANELLCLHSNSCGACQSCLLQGQGQHPDFYCLQPDKADTPIKIDQVRELQIPIYTAPQLNHNRVVLIKAAERMNNNAANALLKILEEPPQSCYFILLAEHCATLLPTVVSRCQQWHFSIDGAQSQYLALIQAYEAHPGRAQILLDEKAIVADLEQVVLQRISPCTVAATWAKYPLHDFIWFLSLLHTEIIRQALSAELPKNPVFAHIAEHFAPLNLFRILDRINVINRSLQKGINLNPVLTLENILLHYEQEREYFATEKTGRACV